MKYCSEFLSMEQCREFEQALRLAFIAIPEGMALVPIEPTEEMQTAGGSSIRFDTTPVNKLWAANSVYKAMLAASQPTPAQGDAK